MVQLRARGQRLMSTIVGSDSSSNSDDDSYYTNNSASFHSNSPLLDRNTSGTLSPHHGKKIDGDSPTATATSASRNYVPPRVPRNENPAEAVAEAAEEKILQVMDLLEDNWEEHAYEDIVPLEIKLALEERVFGWSHLVSAFFGYTFFTTGAFALSYACLWRFTQTPSTSWIRMPLCIFAAIASFRMVRRRRRVWFRSAYGTKQYKQDEARRRKEVEQVDKTTWLGRLRKLSKQRKVARQLQKAETSFSMHHERRLLRAESQPVSTYSSFKSKRRLSFRTDPLPIMKSIQQDQITFADGLIHNVLYSHGGFFGAAPFLLANPHWISILRTLMPDVYVEISRRVKAPPQRLMHWAENNPVVAAYGTAHELEYTGFVPSLEWDVFLDPVLVKRVLLVLRERTKFLVEILPEVDPAMFHQLDESHFQSSSQSQRSILRYYDKELQKRVRVLVDKMLIAHGSLTALALEQTGFAKNYNYSRVKRTRRTLGGGIYARQWMAVYAESLRIGVTGESGNDDTGSPPMSPARDSIGLTTLDVHVNDSCPNTTLTESVSTVKNIAKRDDDPTVGLVLDLKSRHVPKQVLGCVVDCLRDAGFHVAGVGSFVVGDIRGVSRHSEVPVKEILFFHSAGDMQQACHDGTVQNGDTVFFNAGSLVWDPDQGTLCTAAAKNLLGACFSTFDPEDTKRNYRLLPFARTTSPTVTNKAGLSQSSTIEAYKERFNLSIGLYVQEFAVDEAAVDVYVQLVNASPHVYDLGMSWGGVNGITLRGIQPHRFTSTDGFWNQRYIAKKWNDVLIPPPPNLV